jgi:hypothetical protein
MNKNIDALLVRLSPSCKNPVSIGKTNNAQISLFVMHRVLYSILDVCESYYRTPSFQKEMF